jgi:hypothetical protein
MKTILFTFVAGSLIAASPLYSQSIELAPSKLQNIGVSVETQRAAGNDAIRVVKNAEIKEFDEPTFAKVKGVSFRNGSIEVKVLSKLAKDAPDFARGFIGVAFRINNDNSKFECIYVRPQNARVDNQLRRNRSTQYLSFPDFKFDRLRKEAPGEYESYADMALDEWIDLRIEVKDAQAKLFINNSKQPVLVVNDLKHGPQATGAIGLWVDAGTEGYFRDLKIRND